MKRICLEEKTFENLLDLALKNCNYNDSGNTNILSRPTQIPIRIPHFIEFPLIPTYVPTTYDPTSLVIQIKNLDLTVNFQSFFTKENKISSIDWGDGNITNQFSHTYKNKSDYIVIISGYIENVIFGNNSNSSCEKIIQFPNNCKKISLRGESPQLPNTLPSTVTDLSEMFSRGRIDSTSDISKWNVSNVTNMSHMFADCTSFNQDISKWNVSNVIDMSSMFGGCQYFNQDISKWNVSNVIDMSGMFAGCQYFNQDISNWNVSNVTNMSHMFDGSLDFNKDISKWNVSNVTNMSHMFADSSFNQDISKWNVSNVIDMSGMFISCQYFNQDISNWNVSKVKDMSYMFGGCQYFNQDISNWNVSNVTNMSYMFTQTTYKKDLSNWLKYINDNTNITGMFDYRCLDSTNSCFNCPYGSYSYQNIICKKIPDGKVLVNNDGGIPTFLDCPNADLGRYSLATDKGQKCNNYYEHGECQTACCVQQLIHCSFACFGFGSCISQCMSDRACKYP